MQATLSDNACVRQEGGRRLTGLKPELFHGQVAADLHSLGRLHAVMPRRLRRQAVRTERGCLAARMRWFSRPLHVQPGRPADAYPARPAQDLYELACPSAAYVSVRS